MRSTNSRPLRQVLAVAAGLALLALSGCVPYGYPGYGYPGYGYSPYGYAPAPAVVVAPPVAVGIGCCWGGWHGGGWGGHWR